MRPRFARVRDEGERLVSDLSAKLSGLGGVPVAWNALPWVRDGLTLPAVAVAGILLYALGVALAARVARTERQPIRLRLLVGMLHVAQPFWRTYGRMRARPLDPLPTCLRLATMVGDDVDVCRIEIRSVTLAEQETDRVLSGSPPE